jgi:serine/threonine-protein kinase
MKPTAHDTAAVLADVFAAVLERPPEERAAHLGEACAGQPALLAELTSLLAAHIGAGGFLERIDTTGAAALFEPPGEDTAAEGRLVGPYRILGELGRGGMGTVYLAARADGAFEQDVALKLVKRGMDSEAILERFRRERQIVARLEHPHIARLLDGGASEDGQPYFAMECVRGTPLTEYCDARRLAVGERLRLFEQACGAVQYAHGRLVVHRDLKPSNILVTEDGELKLLDFGIAKLLTEEGTGVATALTREGAPPLTPEYAAPEQFRDEPVTTAADVYALGVVLYELLAGRRPHERAGKAPSIADAPEPDRPSAAVVRRVEVSRGDNAAERVEPETVAAARSTTPERLRRMLAGDLDTIVLQALRFEPVRRYSSAGAMAEDLRRYRVGLPVTARPDTMRYRMAKFVRRHGLAVAAAVLVTVALVAGLATSLWQAGVAARERDAARREAVRAQAVQEFLVRLFKGADPTEAKGRDITARELLERGMERIQAELAGEPGIQAELLHAVADIYQSLGRNDRARPLQDRSLELLRQVHGPEHVLVARGIHGLAGIVHGTGEYDAAEKLYREALAMRQRLLPPDQLEIAESLDGLGTLLTTRAKLAEAETLHRRALAIRQRRLGLDHPDTAITVSNLANLLWAKGDYQGAEEQHREALRVRRKALGNLDPRVAVSLSSLGAAVLARGDPEGAEALHREALDIRRRLFGEEHPSVALSVHHLAAALHSEGKLREAEVFYRQALDLDRNLLGRDHPSVAVGLTNLANVLADEGRFGEAKPLFEQALALHRRASGARHPRVARSLGVEASALIAEGRPREALRLLPEALAINRASYGDGHPTVAGVVRLMAKARADLGELPEAEKLFREALEVQRRTLPEAHYATADSLLGLGEVLLAANRPAEAEPYLREALRQTERTLPARHWRRAEVQSVLGACLWRLAPGEEARSRLAAGYEGLRSARGEGHPSTRKARQRLREARQR